MGFFERLFKKYRRSQNILNSEQNQIIANEIDEIQTIADKVSDDAYKASRTYKDLHDNTCPNCREKKDIVNKIARVNGSGSVGGSFALGYGSVSGSMSIDTDEVRHCNKCGNEWKVYKIDFISKTDVVTRFMNAIHTHIEGKYTFADEDFNRIKPFHAETIYEIINNGNYCYSNDLYYSTKALTLSELRQHFKSIHDA